MTAAGALPPDVADFIQGGVSITLASRDERLLPSIAKGVGCRVAPAGDTVTLLVFRVAAEALVRDVAHCGEMAVVFSQPSSNRTLQLKGRGVQVAEAAPSDMALVRRYIALFADELRPLGWGLPYVQAVFWHEASPLVALRFTPQMAFQQTPGPQAGQALALGPGAAS